MDLVISDSLLAMLRESVALCSVLTHFLSIPRYLSSCLINFLQRSTELLGACKRGFYLLNEMGPNRLHLQHIHEPRSSVPGSVAMTLTY